MYLLIAIVLSMQADGSLRFVEDPPPMDDFSVQLGDLTLSYHLGEVGSAAAGPVIDVNPFTAYSPCHRGPGEVFEVEFEYCWPSVDADGHIIWVCFQSHENAMEIYLCLGFDEDGDEDVDLADFAAFQSAREW